MPAGALPVGIVRQEEEYYNSVHRDDLTEALRQCARGSKGLPVGVQVVGMPFEEIITEYQTYFFA